MLLLKFFSDASAALNKIIGHEVCNFQIYKWSSVVNFRNVLNKLTFESDNDMEFWWFLWRASDVFYLSTPSLLEGNNNCSTCDLWLQVPSSCFFFHVDFRLGESLDSGGLTVAFFFAGGTVLVDGNHWFFSRKGVSPTQKLIFRSIFGRSTRCSHWVEDRILYILVYHSEG